MNKKNWPIIAGAVIVSLFIFCILAIILAFVVSIAINPYNPNAKLNQPEQNIKE